MIRKPLLAVVLVLLILEPADARTPEDAFRELSELEIPYSGDSFVEYALEGKTSVVKLFLGAGISPDTRDEEGYTALMWAAMAGHSDIVSLLLDKGADQDARDKHHGMTALMHAAREGRTDVVELLLGRGAQIDAWDEEGRTALFLAAGCKIRIERRMEPGGVIVAERLLEPRPAVVEFLLSRGADPNAADENDRTALMNAAWHAELEIVRALLDAGADPNKKDTHPFMARGSFGVLGVRMLDFGGWTALMYTMMSSNLKVVQALLDAGANPNVNDPNGVTPLMIAVFHQGRAKVVQALLQAGADPSAKDGDGDTALVYAMDGEHPLLAHTLRKAMRKEVSDCDMPALLCAAENGDAEKVKGLLESGADVNAESRYGQMALHLAAIEGHADIVIILLKGGADVNAKTASFDQTPLHVAVSAGRLEVVKALLDNDADITFPGGDCDDCFGGCTGTPLIVAAANGHIDIARLLLDRGAGLQEDGTEINAALMSALFGGHVDIAALLLEKGADAGAKSDPFEITALIIAVAAGRGDMVKILIDNGANVNQGGHEGTTPLIMAVEKGHADVVKLLLTEGADVNAKDNDDMTALMHAERMGRKAIANLIGEAEANE